MAAAKTGATAKAKQLPVGTKEGILAADDLQHQTVDVPEWGCSVVLRQLKRIEIVDAEREATVGDEIDWPRCSLYKLASALVEPTFDFEEIMALNQKNASVVGKLITFQDVLQGGGANSLKEFEKSLLDK